VTTPSFNLVDDPWIPVESHSGDAEEVGLRGLFARAHDLRRISDQSPLVTAAVYRLVFAVAHRALAIADENEWLDAWDACALEGPADAYLEKWRHRFELFDDEAPFAQVRDLPDKCRFPWTKLALERAPNSSKLLFDHTNTLEPPSVEPATAVRSLLASQSFTVGAGKSCTGYTSGAPLSGALAVIPEGRDVAETILGNLFPGSGPDDLPVWEAPPLTCADVIAWQGQRTWAGPASRLTWPSRAVRLLPENEAGRVKWVLFGMGLKPIAPEADRDPWVSYRVTKEGRRVPLRLNLNRLVWRDLHAMLHGSGDVDTEPVQAVSRLATLDDAERRPPRAWTLLIAGHLADKASVLAWCQERWTVPTTVIGDAERTSLLAEALRQAEEAAGTVRSAAWRLAAELVGEGRDAADVRAVVAGIPAERAYWAELASRFQGYLAALGDDPDQAHRSWRLALADAVGEAADAAHTALGRDVKAIRAWAKCAWHFERTRRRFTEPDREAGGEEA
jgi:CRISPR system Cascade subunit CasA